jgi:hypothetical protein
MTVTLKRGSRPTSGTSTISNERNIKWISDYALAGEQAFIPPTKDRSIGVPGALNFGLATDTKRGQNFFDLLHIPSASIINSIPNNQTISPTIQITNETADPFFDPLGNNYGTPITPFRRSQTGYTVGTPGTTDYGIATNSDDSTPLLFVTHIPSASIVNTIPSTDPIFSASDPFQDSTGAGFSVDGEPFTVSTLGYTIGTPGTTDFGFGTDLDTELPLLFVTHIPSASIVNTIPSTDPIFSASDPFQDSTGSGFSVDGEPFTVSTLGYTIGVAGELNFAIAVDLDSNDPVLDPTHIPSASVM